VKISGDMKGSAFMFHNQYGDTLAYIQVDEWFYGILRQGYSVYIAPQVDQAMVLLVLGGLHTVASEPHKGRRR